MNWIDALENPQAVRSLFRDVSALSLIQLHEVTVDREGPVLRLRFDVPAVPSPLPAKWPMGADTTQFTIAAWGIGELRLSGWATTVSGSLAVSRSERETQLEFTGPACQIKATFALLRVERISGYAAR